MKLIIAIVQDEDASRVVNALMNEGYSVTKLATTGGFLKAGNTTLMMGIEDEHVKPLLDVLERACKSRRQTANVPSTSIDNYTNTFGSGPVDVIVGGATVFVLAVDQFIKY